MPRARPSVLRVAARSSAATATASAPRRIARSAAASRSAATDSSGTSVAAARCHAARSKSPTTAARAAWARCRSAMDARCWIADRMSGWRNRSEGPSTTTRRASTAGVRADAGTPAAASISATPSRSSNAAINRSHCVSAGRSPARASNVRSSRALRGRTSGSTSPDAVSRIVAESSASASGFPAASRTIRSRTEGSRSGAEARYHLPGVAVAQRLESQLVDAGRIERRCLALAKLHHHHEGIGAEAAGDESERIGGWAVEPLDVVGDDQDRRVGGRVGEQRERREGDQEWIVGHSLDEAERPGERRVLRPGQRARARPGSAEEAGGGPRTGGSSRS